jgi:lysophospholipase L1-like esterase
MAGRRFARTILGITAVALLSACGSTPAPTATSTPTPSPTAQASARALIPVAGQPPVTGKPWYLAIGDSVTFGFTVDPARLGTNSSWALQLQPLLAATGRTWSLYDTACVSERTDTYYTRCPGRGQTPFLATTSQHDVAMAAIAAHRADLRAVFVDLGSNDLLSTLRRNTPLPAAVTALRTALTRIVTELQAAAPGVPLVLANFYNPLANLDPATQPQITVVNSMVADVARTTGSRLADFFSAIDSVTTGADPHLCDNVDCAHGDIHPTVAGQARLAKAALAALGAA